MYIKIGKIKEGFINCDKLSEILSGDVGLSVDRSCDGIDYDLILNSDNNEPWSRYIEYINFNFEQCRNVEPNWVSIREFNRDVGRSYRYISRDLWNSFVESTGAVFNNLINDRRSEEKFNYHELCFLNTENIKSEIINISKNINNIDESNYELIDFIKWIVFWITISISKYGNYSAIKLELD